jgi:porin
MRTETACRKRRRVGRRAGVVAAALSFLSCLSPSPAGADSADTLLGDIGGLRTVLDRYGATFALSETGEVSGNLSGGLHRGFAYDGLTNMGLTIHTGKAFGWSGGTLHASALQIHGINLTPRNFDVLQTISNIEADRATRLWELWYQQTLPGIDADIRFGQQSLDQEFLVSGYSGLFINGMNGWPALPSNDLYAGGPVYPLSSLGVRLRAAATKALTVLAGVFDDNPPGGPFFDDSQVRDGEASGTRFNLGTGTLSLAEIQYHADRPPFLADRHANLSGTYKLGAWVDTGSFPDQRFDVMGLSLAAPDNTGLVRQHRGNFSIYGVVDQAVWQPDPKGERLLGTFLRVMGAPDDRNLVDFSVDAGLVLHAPLPGRPQDGFGIAYGLAKVSGRAAALDRDRAFFTGLPLLVRSKEQVIEVTYQFQLTAWWQLPGPAVEGEVAAKPIDRAGHERAQEQQSQELWRLA